MYSFKVELNVGFNAALELLKDALQAENFGTASEIDVQATVKKKANMDMLGYRIVGACIPIVAKKIIDADADAGNLLPCNIVVRELEGNKSVISFMNPKMVLGLANNEDIAKLADDAYDELQKVKQRLLK
ncbi:MAG: DUF302 domain-containing protein [Thiomargarita sp.]|nr:DUF302 domain-containing protein [Thiomargarita sp.]